MALSGDSVDWSIRSLDRLSDSDLFPRPIELDALVALGSKASTDIATIDLSSHVPAAPRRFIVPKDDLSYRAATQLDPLDSIIFTALVYQHGAGIEARRAALDSKTVFSYRFRPDASGALYAIAGSWNEFWTRCQQLSYQFGYALVVDIADYYNQISHHTVENQLNESGFPNQATKWILRLLSSVTAKVSRGIPVGPHPSHLLAEASMIPVDNSIQARGLVFCRFVDDFVVFARTEAAAREALYLIADVLDKQQRLHLQRSKTRIISAVDLRALCAANVQDRPINPQEADLLTIIRRHTGGDPYRTVMLSSLSDEELRAFHAVAVTSILEEYLAPEQPDYVRLRWFLRRLAQIAHPGAVTFCLQNLAILTPALPDVCHYLVAVASSDSTIDWHGIGDALLMAISSPLIQSNEYFLLSMYGLFCRDTRLDHVPELLQRYRHSPPALRREIILAAAAAKQCDWLRELKEDASGMDPWTKRAYLYASHLLPSEERRFFLKTVVADADLDQLIIAFARQA